MELLNLSDRDLSVETSTDPFPRDVEFVISAMEACPRPETDRQKLHRFPYRVRATLRLYSDRCESGPALLYTRHIHALAVGFLTNRRLPISHGGLLRIRSPRQDVIEIGCTVLRCREVASGWFEGALYFNREQPAFAPEQFE